MVSDGTSAAPTISALAVMSACSSHRANATGFADPRHMSATLPAAACNNRRRASAPAGGVLTTQPLINIEPQPGYDLQRASISSSASVMAPQAKGPNERETSTTPDLNSKTCSCRISAPFQ